MICTSAFDQHNTKMCIFMAQNPFGPFLGFIFNFRACEVRGGLSTSVTTPPAPTTPSKWVKMQSTLIRMSKSGKSRNWSSLWRLQEVIWSYFLFFVLLCICRWLIYIFWRIVMFRQWHLHDLTHHPTGGPSMCKFESFLSYRNLISSQFSRFPECPRCWLMSTVQPPTSSPGSTGWCSKYLLPT